MVCLEVSKMFLKLQLFVIDIYMSLQAGKEAKGSDTELY